MESLTSEEKSAINELRERMKGDLDSEKQKDDVLFYRFLKARDFDLDAAESMLRKHLEWRKENKVDDILKTYKPHEVLEKYFRPSRIGFDKDGDIVYYVTIGKLDIKRLFRCCKPSDLHQLYMHVYEEDAKILEEQSRKLGKKVFRCTFIHDLDGLTFAKATDKRAIELLIHICLTWLANYPERLKTEHVINSSVYFSMLFSILKKFLPVTVLNKIIIYGADGWQKDLLEQIDADVLPAFLGGNRRDPDGNPLCKTFVMHGGEVPEKYCGQSTRRQLANQAGTRRVVLPRASFHEETVSVSEGGSLLEWEFETRSRDIGFGLFFQDLSEEEERMLELVPIQRIAADEYTESGVYKCERKGTYVVLFDNTYSWLRPKEIHFKVSVISPEAHEKTFDGEALSTVCGT